MVEGSATGRVTENRGSRAIPIAYTLLAPAAARRSSKVELRLIESIIEMATHIPHHPTAKTHPQSGGAVLAARDPKAVIHSS